MLRGRLLDDIESDLTAMSFLVLVPVLRDQLPTGEEVHHRPGVLLTRAYLVPPNETGIIAKKCLGVAQAQVLLVTHFYGLVALVRAELPRGGRA